MIRYKRCASLEADDVELIQKLAEGHSVKTIAAERGMSPANLNYKVRKILSALGASRIPNMIHIAWERGILKKTPPDISKTP